VVLCMRAHLSYIGHLDAKLSPTQVTAGHKRNGKAEAFPFWEISYVGGYALALASDMQCRSVGSGSHLVMLCGRV
jgi:hypothetical protein